MTQILQCLKKLGYQHFRAGQQEAVETLLQKNKLLLVAPTGGGKSLCYQLPALMLPGTTLVISPLIALMQDQVESLQQKGIAATFLASTLSSTDIKKRYSGIARGAYQLVYIAPERLVQTSFQQLLQQISCPLIAIDEAHCISEWGHDFRPEYLKIAEFIALFPNVKIMACTATATPVVRDEILEKLSLGFDTPQIVRGFARPNIAMFASEVSNRAERHKKVDAFLGQILAPCSIQHQKGVTIIYGSTRKQCTEEANRLAQKGWRVGLYHAGLDNQQRTKTQTKFLEGQLQIMVATNAFGMGIDRADVRLVIHLSPPGSIEAYYQEIGRAGRDGLPSWSLLLTCPSDMPLRRYLLEKGAPGMPPPSPEILDHKWNLFLELMRWSEGGSCRHDAILRYFGDQSSLLAGCGHCDICVSLSGQTKDRAEHVQDVVRKALSGVARLHGRFGLKMVVTLLRGKADNRLSRLGLDKVRTFGVLASYSETWLMSLLRRLISAGLVDFMTTEMPVIALTQSGLAVMKGEKDLKILLPAQSQTEKSWLPSRQSTASGPLASSLSTVSSPNNYPSSSLAQYEVSSNDRLFEALRQYRLQEAQKLHVPPYVVASDRTLRDMAALRPRNASDMLMVSGMGPKKTARFGVGFLEVVARFLATEKKEIGAA